MDLFFCNGVHVAFLLLSVMAASVSFCDYNVILCVCVCVLWCGCSSEKTDTVCDCVWWFLPVAPLGML